MMKVLIADDEKKVAKLIYQLVNWQQWGLEVMGVVHDGRQALQLIRSEKPDIVITDIRMPGFNGIELIQEVQKEENRISFVIISGYSEFKYAQQALKLGVEDYLLKPIKRKDLVAVLDKIVGKRNDIEADEKQKETIQSELQKTKEQARNNLLRALIVNNENSVGIESQFFAGQHFQIVIARVYITAMQQAESKETFDYILSKVQTLLSDTLKLHCTEMVNTIWKNEVVCLLNGDALDRISYDELLNCIRTELSSIQLIYPGAKVVFGLGRQLDSVDDFQESLGQLHLSMIGRFKQINQIIFLEEAIQSTEKGSSKNGIVSPQQGALQSALTSEFRQKMDSCIEGLDVAGLQKLMKEVADLMNDHLAEYGLVQKTYLDIIKTFSFGTRKYHGIESAFEEDLCEGIERVYRFRDLMSWLSEQCAELLIQTKEEKMNSESKPIFYAKQYIAEHYGEPLTLELVASEIGFNTTYFSSVFKKATGQNFVDYLTQIRMENAKKMLAQSEMDLNIISEKIGYATLKYFSKIFKKHTGITPSEYRRLYG